MRFNSRAAAIYAAGLLTGALLVSVRPGIADGRATKPFPDVPANHWAAQSVADLKKKGIITTPATSTYNGNQYVTRYEAAALIDRFVHYIEQGEKPLHTSQLAPQKMPEIPAGAGYGALTDLVQNKFINAGSPLLQQPGTKPVKASELSEAMAQAVNRLSDRHLPPAGAASED